MEVIKKFHTIQDSFRNDTYEKKQQQGISNVVNVLYSVYHSREANSLLPNRCGFSMNVRRIRTLSSSRPSDISVWLGGGKRHGAKIVARFELVMRFSEHLREAFKKDTLLWNCDKKLFTHLLFSKASILKNTVN